jgi:hypothetical protein
MAQTLTIEQKLARLGELRRDPAAPGAEQELAACLSSKINLLTAKAARIAGDFRITGLVPLLLDAFDRYLVRPEATDKGCAAKFEIVRALCAIEHPAGDVFLRGARHIQREPSFGPPVDTAAELRGASVVALVRMAHPEGLTEAVRLLVDAEPQARLGAVRAVLSWGQPEAALLLRLKVLAGDRRPEVLSECFAGLLALAPRDSLGFVAGYLDAAEPALAEVAALTLGESRLEAAFDPLRRKLESRAGSALRRALLLALAMLRDDAALEYLLARLAAGERDVLAALDLYRGDQKVQARIKDLLTS